MGAYISREDVRVRLLGKVRFTDNEDDENKFQFLLLDKLITEAESDVEHDLSRRYAIPFVTSDDRAFKFLHRTSFNYIRTLCELKAVIRVLETDYGRGTVVEADKYIEKLAKRYTNMVKALMEKKKEGLGWMYPPLPMLKFNYMNTEADDGFAGMVLTTSNGDGDFPRAQINDPGETYWNGTIDSIDTGNKR